MAQAIPSLNTSFMLEHLRGKSSDQIMDYIFQLRRTYDSCPNGSALLNQLEEYMYFADLLFHEAQERELRPETPVDN